MDNPDHLGITGRVSQMHFRVYSAEEIRKMSVKEIRDPNLFDSLQLPREGGLHDPALGCTRNDDVCDTCSLSGKSCPGHMAHIELPLPVFSPVFFRTLFRILKGSCLLCHRLLLKDETRKLFICQMTLLEKGFVTGAQRIEEYMQSYIAEKDQHFDHFKDELFSNLDNMVKDIMEEDTSQEVTHSTKMVHAEITELVTNTQKLLANPPQVCPHCGLVIKNLQLRSEYSIRIVASGSITKKPSKSKKRKHTEEDTDRGSTELEEECVVKALLEKGNGQCMIMPNIAQKILRKVLAKDGQLLRRLFPCLEELGDDDSATDVFFLSVVAVPPNHFRPLNVMGDRKFVNPQTAMFSRILEAKNEIEKLITEKKLEDGKKDGDEVMETVEKDGKNMKENLRGLWTKLQSLVNTVIDSSLDKRNANKLQGVRQLLEKKEGLFRKHMMGKRVNFSARSVITPDVNIATNEIGVPDVFARKLTYPQPVTPWNVHELRKNVINGPSNYPGAYAVVYEDGRVVRLSAKDRIQREALAKTLLTPPSDPEKNQLPKKVLRHLKNGDVLLLNRQPTLHRPSIQAHKARVLPGEKTLRLHYSSCKAYNADFDGDEMNAHFPQSELGRAEAYGVASTDMQYLVPKDGAPLAGLIQDHLVAGVTMALRGQFFNREDYCQLVSEGVGNTTRQLVKLHPAIVKPGPFWSGKQIISTVLLNLIPKDKLPPTFKSKAKVPEKSWVQTPPQDPWMQSISMEELLELGESTVVVRDGELLQGVLDKSQCGPSSFGLVHFVYELYGGEVAGQLLTSLGRVFTAYLQRRGFTLGVEDILVKEKAEKQRKKIIKKSSKKGHKAALEAFGLAEEESSDEQLAEKLREAHLDSTSLDMLKQDVTAKNVTFMEQDKIADKTGTKGLYKNFPDNNLQLMAQCGAKGSSINCLQMSGLLGQVELEGRRPPLMASGKPLPSFKLYDTSLRARGFVTGRFLTGIRPQEFLYHCMAGREGLVDTAVKTSSSGYLQRCLIKHMEGLSVRYDMTVRDSDGSVIQFLYGEDGLEVTKTALLEEKQLPFLLENQNVQGTHLDEIMETKGVKKHKKKINKWQKKHRTEQTGRRSSFLDFCKTRSAGGSTEVDKATGLSAQAKVLEVEWRSLDPKERHKFLKKYSPCPDPVLAKFWPQQNFGIISEKLQKSLSRVQQQLMEGGRSEQDEAKEAQSEADCETLAKLVNYRYMRSLCEPGDPVGILCAQSVGEQTTQMTLNTFHHAGRGEMNVTMGIPRLREILITASSKIMTPCMDVPVHDTPEAAQAAKNLLPKMNRVFLSDVLQCLEIDDWVEWSPTGFRLKIKVRFVFLSSKMYSDKLQMKPKAIIKLLEQKSFFGKLGETILKTIAKQLKQRRESQICHTRAAENIERQETSAAEANGDDSEGDSDLDEGADDGDASTVRARQRHSDRQEYEGEGEEEEREEEEETERVGDSSPSIEIEEDNPPEERAEEMETEAMGETEAVGETEVVGNVNAVRIEGCPIIENYSRHKGKWCEVTYQLYSQGMVVNIRPTVEKEVKKFTLQSVPGIKRCMLIERSDDERFKGQDRLFFVTEGVNLKEMMLHSDVVDMKYMYTNNIADIQETYGIEAAYQAIIKEMQKVFKAYSIHVDFRHLSLLADYMICEGQYKGFSRHSIPTNPSPLQKITFETATHFLADACLNASSDHLKSPSAQIVAGRVVSSGTGCFDVLTKLTL